MPLTGGPGLDRGMEHPRQHASRSTSQRDQDERLTATAAPGLIAQPGYRTELAGGLLHSTC